MADKRSREAGPQSEDHIFQLYGLEPPSAGRSGKQDDLTSNASIVPVDSDSDSEAEEFPIVVDETPQPSQDLPEATPGHSKNDTPTPEPPKTCTPPQADRPMFFDLVQQHFVRVCAIGQCEIGEAKPDGKGFMLVRWPEEDWQSTEHTELAPLPPAPPGTIATEQGNYHRQATCSCWFEVAQEGPRRLRNGERQRGRRRRVSR
jgi:hypothetical protein